MMKNTPSDAKKCCESTEPESHQTAKMVFFFFFFFFFFLLLLLLLLLLFFLWEKDYAQSAHNFFLQYGNELW